MATPSTWSPPSSASAGSSACPRPPRRVHDHRPLPPTAPLPDHRRRAVRAAHLQDSEFLHPLLSGAHPRRVRPRPGRQDRAGGARVRRGGHRGGGTPEGGPGGGRRHRRAGGAPSGQTGIFIEGWGIAVDAVVADFMAGAVEQLVLQGAEGHDIVLVEGQGSLIHPGYSGVTLGLLHGACPDALILCHQATRDYIGDYHGREPWVRIPSYRELIDIYERAAAPVHPTKVIGICLNKIGRA